MNVEKNRRFWREQIEALGGVIERTGEQKHLKFYVRDQAGHPHVFTVPRGSRNGRDTANRMAELRRRLG